MIIKVFSNKTYMINKSVESGWVIVNIGHPVTGKKYILSNSFRWTKTLCIKEFIKYSKYSWRYWYCKYNFRAKRATKTIEIN